MKLSFARWLVYGVVLFPLAGKAADISQINIRGTINPATTNYIERAIELSTEAERSCLIIQLDTPGGLLESTQNIVKLFYTSSVPVVVYVAPTGANAGSAGCFITLAADVAAMAPNTSIGAAHPVALGGGSGELNDTMNTKLENFAASYIEAIAEKRGRNVEWAIASVRESASITSEKALELKVIELIATDTADLLQQLDGYEVNGAILHTSDASVEDIPMVVREKVFQMLWRPEVMFILMLVAIYGIMGELSNPGLVLPGVIGIVALILVLYMSAILPINIAGVALMVLAVGLFLAEAFTPTFGLLSLGGALSFFIGSLMLFDNVVPDFRLPLSVILPATVITTLFFIFVVSAGLKAQRLPIRTGSEILLGMTAEALTDINEESGHALIEGENWACISNTPISKGQLIEVIGRDGLFLIVKPKTTEDTP